MSESDRLYAVVVTAPPAAAEILQDLLAAEGFDTAVEIDLEHERTELLVYAAGEAQARDCRADLAGRQGAWDFLPGPPTVAEDLRVLVREDWQESWKRHFHARRVSDRIVIKPSWEDWDAAADDCVLEIDPGMSFGTGQHATTVACLQLLDAFAAARPRTGCIDAGCGSGILAIAAARLGLAPVQAFDNDPDAVRIARDNAAANGVGEIVHFAVCDLGSGIDGTADLVLANILAPVVIANAAVLADAVAPGGRIVLSGILADQYPEVRACWTARGWTPVTQLTIDEWTSAALERDSEPRANTD